MNVLVVEDNAWQREETARVLRQAGMTVRGVGDVLMAIDSIDEQSPDCIVLDMMLPGSNGMTLLHELRSHDDLAKIPIVACTAADVHLVELQPYGVVAILPKPTMTPQDLVAKVQGAC